MKHFSIEEMCKSVTATKYGIDNTPTDAVKANLTKLVENVLDPAREKFGAITINCGYRSPKLNAKVGGVSNSQHVSGEAADCDSSDNLRLAKILSEGVFDQLILESCDRNGVPAWVHVSYSSKNRKQILKMEKVNGKSTYKPFKF